jgi:hypothetical protein
MSCRGWSDRRLGLLRSRVGRRERGRRGFWIGLTVSGLCLTLDWSHSVFSTFDWNIWDCSFSLLLLIAASSMVAYWVWYCSRIHNYCLRWVRCSFCGRIWRRAKGWRTDCESFVSKQRQGKALRSSRLICGSGCGASWVYPHAGTEGLSTSCSNWSQPIFS